MKNLNQLLNRLWQTKSLVWIMLALVFVGIADTAYLTANHYFGGEVKCIITEGCEVVLTSQYSQIFSIPLAALGLVFYSGMFVVINLFDVYRERILIYLLMLGGAVGFLMSLVFLYIQLFVIHALCFYCLTSLASSTLLFITITIIYRRKDYSPVQGALA